ncbi:anti-sigma factor [Patulibacter sp.]|uniref:anti-sigma factor n=1 Tax=Patulibacter sp. TaxID=1912859 RepID=UPI0027231770|nr:anti-sigma factor [Patulibacter sp.]MDO9408259.1 anti-sigma factor [Patulibacter sp.]
MTRRPDPESLILDDLDDAEREALLAGLDPREAHELRTLGEAFSSLEADGWRDAQVPPLRFEPDGVGQPTPFLYRGCVREDGHGGRIPAPLAFAGIAAMLVVALIAGVVLGGGTSADDAPATQARVDTRLESARPVSLVRLGNAPVDASGLVRMVPGRDGRMMLRAHGLLPTGERRWYEVWMMRDARHMVSVGTFRVRQDGTVEARFDTGVDPAQYPTMDVSLQSAADGTTHSGRSVLRSRAAS